MLQSTQDTENLSRRHTLDDTDAETQGPAQRVRTELPTPRTINDLELEDYLQRRVFERQRQTRQLEREEELHQLEVESRRTNIRALVDNAGTSAGAGSGSKEDDTPENVQYLVDHNNISEEDIEFKMEASGVFKQKFI